MYHRPIYLASSIYLAIIHHPSRYQVIRHPSRYLFISPNPYIHHTASTYQS